MFLMQLEAVVADYARTGRVVWRLLVQPMEKVADFRDRLLLFQTVWQQIELLPSEQLFAALERGLDPSLVASFLSKVTPYDYDVTVAARALLFRTARNASDSTSVLKRFSTNWPSHDGREWINLGWSFGIDDDPVELQQTLVELGLDAKHELFHRLARSRFLKRLAQGERLVAMMEIFGLTPSLQVFSTMADSCKSFADADRFLELMDARSVKPDAAIFVRLNSP
jgi:hypothetical protein